jgi:energy-coupling factor transporter ATP-binding protein EcfA2
VTTTGAPLAIEATGLEKSFEKTRAVAGIDLSVPEGAIYGVLGPNGAGKATVIRMLATLIPPDAGTARVLGHDIRTEGDAVRGSVSLTGPLLGSLLGDSVRYVIAGTVIIVLGVVLGFRPEGGALGAVAALALVVVFSFGSWVFSVLGLLLRSPNAVMNAGFMAIFPLTFLSNVFVDPGTLPGPLEAFVEVNPISILATASRSLMEGRPDAVAILVSLAVAAVLASVFLPITTRLYRSR